MWERCQQLTAHPKTHNSVHSEWMCVCESSLSARGVKCRSRNLKNTTAVVFSLLLGTICPSQNKLFMYLFWSKTVDFYMLTAEPRHVLCSVLWLSGKHDCYLSCSVLYIYIFFWMSNALFQITIEWPSLFLKVNFNRDIRKTWFKHFNLWLAYLKRDELIYFVIFIYLFFLHSTGSWCIVRMPVLSKLILVQFFR